MINFGIEKSFVKSKESSARTMKSLKSLDYDT
jgi:hypothetical protein